TFILFTLIAGMTFGLWFAPLNVAYRDVQQFVPILIQVLMYLSPVFYSPSLVPENWRTLYFLNPMAGIIQGFRWTLLADQPPPLSALFGLPLLLLAFVGGLYYFRRTEASLADNL